MLLPKVLGTEPAGFQVTAVVPEDLELLPPTKLTPLLEWAQQTPHEQLWRPDPAAEGAAEQIAVAWRPYRPEVAVESTIDLVFVPGQCRARQELILRSPHSVPARLLLRVPPDLTLSVQGGRLADESAGKSVRRLTLIPVRNAEQEARLVLTYSFAAEPGANGRAPADLRAGLDIPLVWVESATTSETRLLRLERTRARPFPGEQRLDDTGPRNHQGPRPGARPDGAHP